MDEAWERAVEAAKGGEDPGTTKSLTLDGALKCAHGRLPPASLFESFTQLRHLSIANVGLSSLTDFPSLPHLEQLILSDNRIAGGLEHLVKAGLKSLQDLDLSNNKIQSLEDLEPLSQLRLVSLDLYECQVTRLPGYRARVFEMMKTLQYLDKADAFNNERPESDEEEEEDSEDEDVDDANGDGIEVEEGVEADSKGGAVTLQDEDDEDGEDYEEREDNDDEDEEEGASYQEAVPVAGRNSAGRYNHDNGSDEEEVEDDEDAEENVEVQDIEESEDEDAGDEDEEEEEDGTEQASGALVSTEGELDVQENDNDEDENGELGGEDEEDDAEEFGVDNDEDDDDAEEEEEEEDDEDEQDGEEYGTEYLVQPIGQPEDDDGASDFEPGDDDEEEDDDFDVEDDDDDEEDTTIKAEAAAKRKRSREDDNLDKKDVRPPKH